MSQKKVALYTLGCKVNQYETEAMAELYQKAGYTVVDFEDIADVYIINTCTVTARSDSKSRNLIRKAKRLNPNAVIGVVGCYAQVSPEDVMRISGVDMVVGTNQRMKIVELTEEALKGKTIKAVENIWQQKDFEGLTVTDHMDKTRAYVKIQEGCNQFCTYCIIPYARGPVRSRPISDALEEVRNLADRGFKEIVLTGIYIASYGKDLEGTNLMQLIEQVNEINGIERIRLSSVSPSLLTEDFVDKAAQMPKLCRHYHISLQSGCDETLRRMHRKYTTSQYKEIVDMLREKIPDVAITTDVIVGFPGETDDEFQESYGFIRKVGFSHMHVFKYSRRKGTPAARYPDQVPNKIKEERSKMMLNLAMEMKHEYMEKFLNTEQTVLFEQRVNDAEYYEGLTDTYIRVLAKSDDSIQNRLISTRLKEIQDDFVIGEIK